MRHSLASTLLFFYTIPILFFNKATPAPNNITACKNSFSCGHLTNISYPFTGGDRPKYCGPLQFQLTCLNSVALLTSNSLSYRVLKIDQANRTLTLARSDLYNTKCTQLFVDTTLDSSIFTVPPNSDIIQLAYGCSMTPLITRIASKSRNMHFYCNVSGLLRDSLLILGAPTIDPSIPLMPCKYSITMPTPRSSLLKLRHNRSFLVDSLKQGFNVIYHIPFDDNCTSCWRLGGICGFDGGFNCFCGNNKLCLGSNSSKVPRRIWMIIAASVVIAACILCWVMIVLIAKNKRKAAHQESNWAAMRSSNKGSENTSDSEFHNPQYLSSHLEKDALASAYFGAKKFSYSELEEATHNFDLSKELGDGGFGSVYHGVLRDGREVAVKRLYETNVRRAVQFMNEVEILTQLRHQNLVALYGFSSSNVRNLLLVYEFVPNGTLADHLRRTTPNSSFLSWSIRLNIAIETADALAYLHASDIIHRDVKTNNILLDRNFHVKVADFGLSRLFPEDVTHISTNPQGTPGYLDPEYNKYCHLTEKSDVYSFGVVLIQLISSLPAVDIRRKKSEIKLTNMAIQRIKNHALNELVDPNLGYGEDGVGKMMNSVAELAIQCLQEEKDVRPTMRQILESLKRIQNENIQSEKTTDLDIIDTDNFDGALQDTISFPL